MKQIEAVDYVETTVEQSQWALSHSDSESDALTIECDSLPCHLC